MLDDWEIVDVSELGIEHNKDAVFVDGVKIAMRLNGVWVAIEPGWFVDGHNVIQYDAVVQ
jgi:hypothetical protein